MLAYFYVRCVLISKCQLRSTWVRVHMALIKGWTYISSIRDKLVAISTVTVGIKNSFAQFHGSILWFQVQINAWLRHQMETFSALLAICAGNSPVPTEFPAQRPVTRSCDVFFDLRLNKRLSKHSWGWRFETLSRPSWHHCNGMTKHLPVLTQRSWTCWWSVLYFPPDRADTPGSSWRSSWGCRPDTIVGPPSCMYGCPWCVSCPPHSTATQILFRSIRNSATITRMYSTSSFENA